MTRYTIHDRGGTLVAWSKQTKKDEAELEAKLLDSLAPDTAPHTVEAEQP